MRNIIFAKTVNDLNTHLPKGRGDCFDYGSWYGCDFDCPQLRRGECEGDLYEVLKALKEDELYELYDNGYYQEEVKEFISIKK